MYITCVEVHHCWKKFGQISGWVYIKRYKYCKHEDNDGIGSDVEFCSFPLIFVFNVYLHDLMYDVTTILAL